MKDLRLYHYLFHLYLKYVRENNSVFEGTLWGES